VLIHVYTLATYHALGWSLSQPASSSQPDDCDELMVLTWVAVKFEINIISVALEMERNFTRQNAKTKTKLFRAEKLI